MILLAIASVLFVGFHQYLQSDQIKVVRNFPFLPSNTEIHTDKIDWQFWESYPTTNATLTNVKYINTETKDTILKFDTLKAQATVLSIWKREIELKEFDLIHGSLNLVTDNEGKNSLNKEKKEKKDKKTKMKKSFFNITASQENAIELKDFKVNIIDSTKSKHLKLTVNDLNTSLFLGKQDTTITGTAKADIAHLNFNWNKGPYLENSSVAFPFRVKIDDKAINIEQTPTNINGDTYLISSTIYPNQPDEPTILNIASDTINFTKTKKLLNHHIQKQLSEYEVAGKFPTAAKIIFTDNVNPRVEIDFRLENNDLFIKGQNINNVKADGQFFNRIYDDERSKQEGKKNLRVQFVDLTGNLDGYDLFVPKGKVTYTPEEEGKVVMDLRAKGNAKYLSQYFKDEPFQFVDGDVDIKASVNGPLKSLQGIVQQSNAALKFKDLDIYYAPSDVVFPFQLLDVSKKGDFAEFTLEGKTIPTNHKYTISGKVEQVADLFTSLENKKTKSFFKVRAPVFTTQDFINMFGSSGYLSNKKEEEPKGTTSDKSTSTSKMKDVISALENKFQPELDVAIDTIYHNDLPLTNFTTKLNFEKDHTLVLSETAFDIYKGNLTMDGTLNLSKPNTTDFGVKLDANGINLDKVFPKVNYFNLELLQNLPNQPENLYLTIDTEGSLHDDGRLIPAKTQGKIAFRNLNDDLFEGEINFSGVNQNATDLEEASIATTAQFKAKPKLLNQLFPNSNYYFKDGILTTDISYRGQITDVEQLIKKAKIDLDIKDAAITDRKLGINIPINSFNANVNNNIGKIDLLVRADTIDQITIDAEVTNLSNFIYENKEGNHTVTANLESERINWIPFQEMFKQTVARDTRENSNDTLTVAEKIAVKESIIQALQSFQPDVTVKVNQLIYSEDVILNNISSQVKMNSSTNKVEITNTGFEYLNGGIELNAMADLSQTDLIPFSTDLQADNFNVAELLQNLNYLNIDQLKEIEQLSGIANIDLVMEGVYNEQTKIIFNEQTNAQLQLQLDSLKVIGFDTIEDLGKKALMKDRFSEVLFAPITTKITIEGNKVHLPFTEIQSNALHAFIEGEIDENRTPNFWITIPFRTVFKGAQDTVPELTENSQGRNRFFIEITKENGESKTKFHLSKKKFFEQRGNKEKFKIYRDRMREERRKRRRNN